MRTARRRFLSIAAAAALVPSTAAAQVWRGRAFGAEVNLTIRGDRDLASAAVAKTIELIDHIENLFSLYRAHSDLVLLNRQRWLAPDPQFYSLMQHADGTHRLTGGLFDPTIQPLWRALAEGGDLERAVAAVGWDRVRFDPSRVILEADQALTFNGIAQGFASDLIAEALRDLGLREILVNIGEYRGLGGPWKLGISDPNHGMLGTRSLVDGAVATSSPAALSLGDRSHILHPIHRSPAHRPRWSTVSVEAETATLADGLSTALVMADRGQIEAVRRDQGVRRITLVDLDGNLTTL